MLLFCLPLHLAESLVPHQHLINVYITTSGLCFEKFLKIRDRERHRLWCFSLRAPTNFGGGVIIRERRWHHKISTLKNHDDE